MKTNTHLHKRVSLPARRFVKAAATITAFAFVLSGAVMGATAAQAAEDVHGSTSIDFGGSKLALDSGVTVTQELSDATIDNFSPAVNTNGKILDWHASSNSAWATARARWRILEDGNPTSYGIRVANTPAEHGCQIMHAEEGQIVPAGDEAPYSCDVESSGNDLVVHLAPVVWSSVVGSLRAEGFVGLDQGHQTSRNARFFVSDSLHKPTDPVANINPGQTTSWNAEMRNGEGATADDGTRTDFSYRITDGGVPTKYYAKGFMQNVKSLAGYKKTYECHIYFHDPDHGGTETEYSPYTCDYDATDSSYGHPNLSVDFVVRSH